jgi:hypothetical protein
MDKELKAKWVAALRSGKYAQGQGDYFDPETGTYCCLGVLDIVDLGDACTNLHLWGEAESKAGESSQLQELIRMNDTGKSFSEIADWIEANL